MLTIGTSIDTAQTLVAVAILNGLATDYNAVLAVTDGIVATVPLINIGRNADGFQTAHREFIKLATQAQRLLVQANEMLTTSAARYSVTDLTAASNIAATQ